VKIEFLKIKLPFIETVFHILNRNLPQATKVWPPGSLILIHLTILSVAYLGEVLTDPLTKKQSLITTIMEVFSNIPREDLKRPAAPPYPG
jgi:hypothetical protein